MLLYEGGHWGGSPGSVVITVIVVNLYNSIIVNNPIITSARYNCVVGITPGVGEGTKYLEILAVNEFAIAFTNTSGRLLFSGNEPLQAALQRLPLFELDILEFNESKTLIGVLSSL